MHCHLVHSSFVLQMASLFLQVLQLWPTQRQLNNTILSVAIDHICAMCAMHCGLIITVTVFVVPLLWQSRYESSVDESRLFHAAVNEFIFTYLLSGLVSDWTRCVKLLKKNCVDRSQLHHVTWLWNPWDAVWCRSRLMWRDLVHRLRTIISWDRSIAVC